VLSPQEDPALTRNWKKTVHVAVTGASGQISNHLLFMLASGEARGAFAEAVPWGCAHWLVGQQAA
jgi:hypothetical protein